MPHHAVTGLSPDYHGHKMVELRQIFRLDEFSKRFTPEDFEEARNKARKQQNFPAENFQAVSAYQLFVKDIRKHDHLWKQLSFDQQQEYRKRSERLKQEISEFEQKKLPDLLKSRQFYWLLRVS